MKKTLLLLTLSIAFNLPGISQNAAYPEPEFSNEVYLLLKDSNRVLRLEKGSSKMDTKTKMGGMAGMENGYTMDGEKSPVRLSGGKDLSFIFSTGVSPDKKTSAQTDSMMRANGIDPAMVSFASGGMMDPSRMITLYQVDPEKAVRKIILMKSGGALPFASKKPKSSDKYSFSVRKIREGYWELVIDKSLPKGEYAFTVMGAGMGSMDGSVTIFSFGID